MLASGDAIGLWEQARVGSSMRILSRRHALRSTALAASAYAFAAGGPAMAQERTSLKIGYALSLTGPNAGGTGMTPADRNASISPLADRDYLAEAGRITGEDSAGNRMNAKDEPRAFTGAAA